MVMMILMMMIVTSPPETDNEDDAGGRSVDNGDDDDNDDTHTNIITRVWTTWMRDARNIKDSVVNLQRCHRAFENMKFSLMFVFKNHRSSKEIYTMINYC